MLLHRVPLTLAGVATVDPMHAPLFLSTSLRDFWGRRWNLVAHRFLKRSFFLPFVRGGCASKHIGAFLTFAMSGLFHEYLWFVINWPDLSNYVPGLVFIFFLVQYIACSLEL